MKILMVLDHEFPPDVRVENEIEILSKAGHEIQLACFTLEDRKENDTYNSIQVRRKPISPFLYKTSVGALKVPIYFNYWKKYLHQLFKEHTYDAIHIHDLPLAKIGYEISKENKIPFILDLHENWPYLLKDAKHTNTLLGKILSSTKQWINYEIEYTKKADKIITVVDEMKNRIVKLGNDRNKIFVVPNTINFSSINEIKFHKSKVSNDNLILIYVGGITAPRGLQYVINGLSHLRNEKIKLWIIGDGTYKKDLIDLTKRMNLDETVTFFGHKSFSESMKLVANADIALIPHIRSVQNDNSSPNKLFQYMYLGKPLLTSNCKSVERIIQNERIGLTYEYNDSKAFAIAVKKLITNKELLNTFSNNCINSIKNKYNWDITGNNLKLLYSSM